MACGVDPFQFRSDDGKAQHFPRTHNLSFLATSCKSENSRGTTSSHVRVGHDDARADALQPTFVRSTELTSDAVPSSPLIGHPRRLGRACVPRLLAGAQNVAVSPSSDHFSSPCPFVGSLFAIIMLSLATIAPTSFALNAPLATNLRASVHMTAAVEPEAPPPPFNPVEFAKAMPGVTAPLGFFDPVGFCSADGVSEGKIRFYREVELKHARVAMLASLGFLVGEQFHPLFGGSIDVPSYVAFQETPLQTFWPAVILVVSIAEVFSVFSFQSPFGNEPWTISSDHKAGDFGFDPVRLRVTVHLRPHPAMPGSRTL